MASMELIAAKAGVSRGTVDRVLHNRGQVKPETAEKVRAVMAELDFQPNTLGRALYLSRKKNKIGILVAFREPDFQKQVMEGVNSGIAYAQQHGVETLVEFAPPGDPKAYLTALESLLASDIQGLALRGIDSPAVSRRLQIKAPAHCVQPRRRCHFAGLLCGTEFLSERPLHGGADAADAAASRLFADGGRRSAACVQRGADPRIFCAFS